MVRGRWKPVASTLVNHRKSTLLEGCTSWVAASPLLAAGMVSLSLSLSLSISLCSSYYDYYNYCYR